MSKKFLVPSELEPLFRLLFLRDEKIPAKEPSGGKRPERRTRKAEARPLIGSYETAFGSVTVVSERRAQVECDGTTFVVDLDRRCRRKGVVLKIVESRLALSVSPKVGPEDFRRLIDAPHMIDFVRKAVGFGLVLPLSAAEGLRVDEHSRIPYRGTEAGIRLNAQRSRIVRDESGAWRVELDLPATAPQERLRARLAGLLKAEAKLHFEETMKRLRPKELPADREIGLRLSSAKRSWGRCSVRGAEATISLHWGLICLDDALTEYVVAHEYAHLDEMNHSPRFWSVLERRMPDCRERDARLDRVDRRLLPILE